LPLTAKPSTTGVPCSPTPTMEQRRCEHCRRMLLHPAALSKRCGTAPIHFQPTASADNPTSHTTLCTPLSPAATCTTCAVIHPTELCWCDARHTRGTSPALGAVGEIGPPCRDGLPRESKRATVVLRLTVGFGRVDEVCGRWTRRAVSTCSAWKTPIAGRVVGTAGSWVAEGRRMG